MKHILCILFFLLFQTSLCFSQFYGNASGSLGTSSGGVGLRVAEIPKTPDSLGEAIYLTPDWQVGSILFVNNRFIKNCSLRCDLGNEFVEIKDKSIIRGVPFGQIMELFIQEESGVYTRMVSGINYLSGGNAATGLYEILIEGQEPLLLRTSVNILKSNGGFTDLQRGDKGIKTLRTEKYYSVSNKELIEIKGMSSLTKICGTIGHEVKNWAKEHKMKPNKKEDLVAIWNYYLSINNSNH